MVRYSILSLAAIATLLLGAEAGPCRPTTTVATSVAETTSTLAADTSATSIDTTTVTTLADTTTTIPGDTTTTALADTTTTDEAESTTTTAAAACVETQLFINPGFDDSASGIAPWTSNANLIQSQPQSGTNALSAVFNYGQPDYYVRQSLQNLNGDYEFSYYYRVVSVSPGADYVCNIELKVGDTSIFGPMYDNVDGWKSGSVDWSSGGETIAQADVQLGLTCVGEFVRIEVNIDTLAFTRVCSA
ncbi:hypothetical protein DER46DRAFT_614839 [Fusarium sp. MPI-SDFR-AT-0072]|uniref:CBM-cenC domain-containing protein n=1 Tax=Fusarium oxysporum f. sp. rapae TaxID=485398 RepID=A0A8J5U4L8_FUSOX|nr:hypothetical protein Forpe1208_v011672 [Fusarium oxysporum f. sp. rapae]KAH7151542.1 hypothetical protein DER46DRAFT_614839 [Fusarium sp. MPI-SDFR-AT-0072]KAI7768184.1 hypothetical protein LZL87_012033 [Fusarium oxysporum]